jgi:AraC family transcriptional regulator of adaptative response / DNA-3-methyladenine glycosylase II
MNDFALWSENGQPGGGGWASLGFVTPLEPEHCYRALCARDPRFDGVFFVGVETTGIYCRPVCPARTPMKSRCRFFDHAAAAEREGFRACLRCRPERAPGQAPSDGGPRLIRGTLLQIAAGALDHMSVDTLAEGFGVTGRHLRRSLESAVGVTPVELAQSRRLGMAKWLIQDTQLPLTEVAFAAGYASIRRFNAAIAARFGCPPSALRRQGTAAAQAPGAGRVSLRIEARPPFAGKALLEFLRGRAIPGIEIVTASSYRRLASIGDATGWLEVELDGARAGVIAHVDVGLLPHVTEIVARVRALFDLDARPDLIDEHLGRDPRLGPSVERLPGLRVPGAFDPWELAVRAILGQQVSVRGATTISGRLVDRFGPVLRVTEIPGAEGKRKAAGQGAAAGVAPRGFPEAELLAAQTPLAVSKIGIPLARAATIVGLAQRVRDKVIDLSPAADAVATVAALQDVAGIGPWTAHYIAMRTLRDPDVFLAGDLAVRKALGVTKLKDAEAASAPWRPWRAYAQMHLWNSLAQGGGG